MLSDNSSIALFLDAFCREAKGMTKHMQTQEGLRTSEIRYQLFTAIEKYASNERAETFVALRSAQHETRSSLGSEDVYLDK